MTFDTGVQQGSVLSPTLFNVFLNPLLRLLTAVGHQKGVSHGIRGITAFNNVAFADDLTIVAEIRRLGVPGGGAQMLLSVATGRSPDIAPDPLLAQSSATAP